MKKFLDREKRDNYFFIIMVIDGIFLLKVIVEVKVLDVNDNSLVCEKILYLDIIFEDVFFGKLIM